ncbi:hypothetical protein BCR44DRAFT_1431168 [Catenaria anguillulae PL171]|uniref:NEDD8-activating enzyme E1 regulatory subunit n=1 Tax=Catenaria anguillulae PL171 TaxID=765915 RepID=A0A1Y2HQU5_9FUNG|nr:hypothetical protein BCR44DRAFT_1431168 [Catenaria anguillulae PL171]
MPAAGPDAKTQKYDRQLRLWQAHGQAALERAHVCLVNATATGTEILKNLVLPGIGAFTIVDGANVTLNDVGNNFFTILATDPTYLHKFSLVIVTGRVPLSTVLAMDKDCYKHGIPLCVVKSAGFVALARTVVRAHHVVEVHPDNPTRDLRLAQPWPELAAFVDSFPDFDSMSAHELGHLPYPVILIRLYKQWRNNDPIAPNREFKSYVSSELARHTQRLQDAAAAALAAQGDAPSDSALATAIAGAADLENWTEAVNNAYHAYSEPTVSSELTDKLFKHKIVTNDEAVANLVMQGAPGDKIVEAAGDILLSPAHANVQPGSTAGPAWPPVFWAMVAGLKAFVEEKGGVLPLRGVVPDMKADTETYVRMQRIYRDKAAKDMADLRSRIRAISIPAVTAAGSTAGSPHPSSADLPTAPHPLHVKTVAWIRDLSSDNPTTELAVYILFRACEYFHASQRRWPGEHLRDFDGDVSLLKMAVNDVIRTLMKGKGREGEVATPVPSFMVNLDDWVQEFVRAGPAELHAVAAFMGGVVSQEAIKLITAQYLPMTGMYVYNGIKSTSTALAC